MKSTRTIRIRQGRQATGEGCNGVYYRISKHRGVKITHNTGREARRLHLINDRCPGIFPKCYGLVRVQVGGENSLQWGILMEHIPGVTFDRANISDEGRYAKRAERLKDKLASVGIEWTDDHEGNMILTPRKQVRFVDVGHYTTVRRRKL